MIKAIEVDKRIERRIPEDGTYTGDLDADDLGLANSFAYKLVMDEDNNRNYFIDSAGEEIETAEVYSSMVDMALASNACCE